MSNTKSQAKKTTPEEALNKIQAIQTQLLSSGVDPKDINAIYNAHVDYRNKKQELRTRRANIENVNMGGGGDNACFLLSIGCKDATEANELRQALYHAYSEIFAYAALHDKERSKNKEFFDYFQLLKDTFESEKEAGTFNLNLCVKENRMLNLADFYMIAFLLSRDIHIVNVSGSMHVIAKSAITPELAKAIGLDQYKKQPTANPNPQKPLYAQKQTTEHYHRITPKGIAELEKVEALESTMAEECQDDEAIFTAISNANAKATNTNVHNLIDEYSRVLESNLPFITNAVPAVQANPTLITPKAQAFSASTSISNQLLALQAKRDALESQLKTSNRVNAAFISELEALHQKRDACISERDALTTKGMKEAVTDLLKEDKNIDATLRGNLRTSLFFAIHGKDAANEGVVPFFKELDKAGKNALTKLGEIFSKDDSEIDIGYMPVKTALEGLYNRLNQLKQEQEASEGDVLNPFDVQLAAIVLRRTIVVVNKAGETHTFSSAVFTDEELAAIDNEELVDLVLSSADKLFQITPTFSFQDISPCYIYNHETNGYLGFTSDGSKAISDEFHNWSEAIKRNEEAIKSADDEIAAKIQSLDQQIPHKTIADIRSYSDLYDQYLAASRERGAQSSGQSMSDAMQEWQKKLESIATVSITASEANERDLHRQNVDVLLTLFLQGTAKDREKFINAYKDSATTAIINLNANDADSKKHYTAPFDTVPMFYAKGFAHPGVVLQSGGEVNKDINTLIQSEIKAYLALKDGSDSALVRDYKAILAALDMGLLVPNRSSVGLSDVPKSVMQPVIQGIHERVSGKTAYVSNMIDANAYAGKFGATADEQKAIREGIHHYRQAVSKLKQTPLPADAPAPKTAHSLKQTSYMSDTSKSKVVFDVKGISLDEVHKAFMENTQERNAALTVKNDKGIDCRLVVTKDHGRLKLLLQDNDSNLQPLTTSVWKKSAGAAVEKVLKEIASIDADLSSSAFNKPRMR